MNKVYRIFFIIFILYTNKSICKNSNLYKLTKEACEDILKKKWIDGHCLLDSIPGDLRSYLNTNGKSFFTKVNVNKYQAKDLVEIYIKKTFDEFEQPVPSVKFVKITTYKTTDNIVIYSINSENFNFIFDNAQVLIPKKSCRDYSVELCKIKGYVFDQSNLECLPLSGSISINDCNWIDKKIKASVSDQNITRVTFENNKCILNSAKKDYSTQIAVGVGVTTLIVASAILTKGKTIKIGMKAAGKVMDLEGTITKTLAKQIKKQGLKKVSVSASNIAKVAIDLDYKSYNTLLDKAQNLDDFTKLTQKDYVDNILSGIQSKDLKKQLTDKINRLSKKHASKKIDGVSAYIKNKEIKLKEAKEKGNLGYHGTDQNFGDRTKLQPSAGTSEAFSGVSIAKDYETAKAYGIRQMVEKQTGLKFRKDFQVLNSEGVITITSKSDLKIKSKDFYIYELAKDDNVEWIGATNSMNGFFGMALNKKPTEWLSKKTLNLDDLIKSGKVKIENPNTKPATKLKKVNALSQEIEVAEANLKVVLENKDKEAAAILALSDEFEILLKSRQNKGLPVDKVIDDINNLAFPDDEMMKRTFKSKKLVKKGVPYDDIFDVEKKYKEGLITLEQKRNYYNKRDMLSIDKKSFIVKHNKMGPQIDTGLKMHVSVAEVDLGKSWNVLTDYLDSLKINYKIVRKEEFFSIYDEQKGKAFTIYFGNKHKGNEKEIMKNIQKLLDNNNIKPGTDVVGDIKESNHVFYRFDQYTGDDIYKITDKNLGGKGDYISAEAIRDYNKLNPNAKLDLANPYNQKF